VAFSPDGQTLATGGFDGTARLRDVAFGHRLGPPVQAAADLEDAGFSPDGKALVTRSAGEVRLVAPAAL
jgi:WD40 repeat protein